MFSALDPTTTVMTRGCRLMALEETTRTGLRPDCSRPCVGLRSTKYICPRLIMPEPIAFRWGEFLRDRCALGADGRVGPHLRHGLFKGLGPAPGDEVTQGNQDQAVQVAFEFRGRYGEHLVHQIARQSDAPAHGLGFLIRHGLLLW